MQTINQIQSRSMWQQNDYASKFDASWEKVAQMNIIVDTYLLVDGTTSLGQVSKQWANEQVSKQWAAPL